MAVLWKKIFLAVSFYVVITSEKELKRRQEEEEERNKPDHLKKVCAVLEAAAKSTQQLSVM